MSVPGRIAMCANPHGLHEHVPLKPDEPMPTTCFADCDCTPVQFVRADATQGAARLGVDILDHLTAYVCRLAKREEGLRYYRPATKTNEET